MAARIAAHITLLSAVDDVAALRRSLSKSVDALGPIHVRLHAPARWGGPDEGIYLPVEDSGGAIAALRHRLSARPTETVLYRPHVTLLHRRTASPTALREAWTHLREALPIGEIVISHVSIVGETEAGWVTTDCVGLM